MKHQILFLVFLVIAISEISCDCGCLKCSRDLEVVSPPECPYQVIVKKSSCGGRKPIPYQRPAYISIPREQTIDHHLSSVNGCPPVYAYKYKVQAPLVLPPILSLPLTGLVARPDRIVLQKHQSTGYGHANCPYYTGDDGSCASDNHHHGSRPYCNSIFQDSYSQQQQQQQQQTLQQVQILRSAPIMEPVTYENLATSDTYENLGCGCRYDHGSRKKRELPILKRSVQFFVDLLPRFLWIPIEKTLRTLQYQGIGFEPRGQKFPKGYYQVKVKTKPSESFLWKLQKLNGRKKRSLVFGDKEIRLPFLRVTDIDNDLDDSEEEDEDEEEEDEDQEEEKIVRKVRRWDPREEYLRPLNFDHIVPHNPIYYLLNAPIRFLHHFHRLGQQISPVFKSVPHVFINSKKYLRSFGKNLKNEVLDFASDFIGDFDDLDAHRYGYVRPRRFRRSLEEPYEPEYNLVFGNHTRRKRYILKVVDEDEVEQFLREKFTGLVQPPEITKKKKEKDTSKKRLVVEQLSPKLIIDNNGRPFVEINGSKRPLFFKKKGEEKTEEKTEEKEEEEEDMKEKINLIIKQAKERIDHKPDNVQQNVPNQMIKDRINQILTEIQDLINLDFDKYSKIHSDLCKLQSFKELLVNEWKKILMENKSNDISSKIRLLDAFKEMQILRDKSVEDIASILSTGSNFMTKKLIKMLVRLQKLQCIIYRVVEDFGETIKMGTEFDERKEIKYVDYLAGLHFIVGRTQHDLERDLKRERDKALENEMKVLESLRQLLEENQHNPQKLYEEAQVLWEIKNIDKLQKDAISEMNGKISRGQKVRKELKILFDLLRQAENCEEKQKNLLKVEDDIATEIVSRHAVRRKNVVQKTNLNRNRNFPHKTIIEDKKPVKIVSNGYTMTGYKISDGFP